VNPNQSFNNEYGGIYITEKGIYNLNSKNEPRLFIEKTRIKNIKFNYGYLVDNPWGQILVGVILILIVILFPGATIYAWLTQGGPIYDLSLVLLWLLPFGLWLLVGALQRGFYLDISLDQGRRKIPIKRKIDPAVMRKHLLDAVVTGYDIEISHPS
jgi:hypothetical protein